MEGKFKKLFSLFMFLGCVFCFCNFNFVYGIDKDANAESNSKLSIVVPVYNVAPYLDEALDSAENQTYKNLEIICVNDGSTDNSLEILEKHAAKDSRIKIITQKNQGLSGARNTGIRAATGKYIYFFDSDDVIAPYIMEKAIGNLEKYDADASEFGYIKFEYNSKLDMSEYPYEELPVEVLECGEGQNPFKVLGTWPVSACYRVYKKSFLADNKLEFKKDLKIIEDVLFNYLSRARMKKLVRDSNIGYFYRVKRPGSIMTVDFCVLKKRLNGKLMIVKELGLKRDRFEFSERDKYLIGAMLELVYNDIKSFKDPSDKRLYAKKAYEEIWTNFAEKYKIIPNKNNKKKLDDLRRWSKGLDLNKKSKKPTKAKATKKVKKVKTKSNKQRKSQSSRGKKNVTKRKNT